MKSDTIEQNICGETLSFPNVPIPPRYHSDDDRWQFVRNIEEQIAYTTRGKCSVYYASRVSVFFFEKRYRMPKIVLKGNVDITILLTFCGYILGRAFGSFLPLCDRLLTMV